MGCACCKHFDFPFAYRHDRTIAGLIDSRSQIDWSIVVWRGIAQMSWGNSEFRGHLTHFGADVRMNSSSMHVCSEGETD